MAPNWLEVDEAIRRRTQMHGWRWPRGTEATVARCLGVTQQRISLRRLDLLLDAIRQVP